MPEALKKLINSISYLPGVGEKSATKLAFFLLNANKAYLDNLVYSLENLGDDIKFCSCCNGLCDKGRDKCNICNNMGRDATKIAIIEDYLDMVTIEDSGGYNGLYHILGGAVSPVNGVFVGDLKFRELFKRIEDSDTNLELILATNPNIEGEATASYLIEEIAKRGLKYKTTITRLSRGLSSGYIEYADNITLLNAMKERKEI